jgi:hypothetical protein
MFRSALRGPRSATPTRNRPSRLAASLASSRSASLYKDILLLVVGALIGVASGIATAVVQGHIQSQQQGVEKRFSYFKELAHLHNLAATRAVRQSRELQSAYAQAVERSLSSDPKQAHVELVASVNAINKKMREEDDEYDAQIETYLMVLGVDPSFSAEALRFAPNVDEEVVLEANGRRDKRLDDAQDAGQVAAAYREYYKELVRVWRAMEDSAVEQRSRGNTELRTLASRLLP